MSFTAALTLMIVMLPLAAMPSASVALVVARTVSAGRINGVSAALGIVAGDLVFIAAALVGMTALAGWLGAFFAVIRYCGGAYLIWLGIGVLRARSALALPPAERRPASCTTDFLAGLLLTLGDVKAILFYASLFPALVDMTSIDRWDVALITTITVMTVGGVKLIYVLFATKLANWLGGRVSSRAPRIIGAAVMIGCGSALIVKA